MKAHLHLSRRRFLRTGAALAAAPFILPSHIWAAETKPNDKINLGFIGTGKQSRGLMSGFLAKPDAQVVAACDVDTNRRNSGRKQAEDFYAKAADRPSYKGCDVYKDFRELLARKDIDAVVIATPDHWHALITIAAANAGKDIYCEKPMCQTVHETQAMTNAVRDKKRILQVGSMQRSSKEFRVACELIRQGRLGKISRVETGFGPPGSWCDLPAEEMEPGLDWDMWLGPAPMRAYNSVLSPRGVHDHFPEWRMYWEYGGGKVTDWGAHHVDIAQWGLDMDRSGPVEVIPPADWKTAKAGGKLIYPDGTELTHIEANGVTFFGSEGQLYVNRGKFKLTLGGKVVADATEKGKATGAIVDAAAREFIDEGKPHLYVSDDHKADFLNCIRKRTDPICPVETGAHSVIACHLLNFGYKYGQKVKWDPVKLTFVGGTGDPAWLTRPYRDPWRVA